MKLGFKKYVRLIEGKLRFYANDGWDEKLLQTIINGDGNISQHSDEKRNFIYWIFDDNTKLSVSECPKYIQAFVTSKGNVVEAETALKAYLSLF